jgi:peptide/nickel transport system substrate-binding protein
MAMECRSQWTSSVVLALVVVVALVGVGASPSVVLAQAPTAGGVLRVAAEAEPPTLDPHWTTASVTAQVALHIFETLFTLDKDGNPIPHLVDSFAISADERVYTLELRKDVRFHDGRLMTSEDAVASLNRWGRVTATGQGSAPKRVNAGREQFARMGHPRVP